MWCFLGKNYFLKQVLNFSGFGKHIKRPSRHSPQYTISWKIYCINCKTDNDNYSMGSYLRRWKNCNDFIWWSFKRILTDTQILHTLNIWKIIHFFFSARLCKLLVFSFDYNLFKKETKLYISKIGQANLLTWIL